MDNHAKITKPALIAGLLLTIVSLSSQFVGSAFAQTAAGTCTQSGIQITCSGMVSGPTKGVFQGPPGQCPTSRGQSSHTGCTIVIEEETGIVEVSIPVTVTSSCNNQHAPVPPFITTTTTTLTGTSGLVSGGFAVKNPGGQITNTVAGTSTFSITMNTPSISTQLPNCPRGLTPIVDMTNVGTPTFTFVTA